MEGGEGNKDERKRNEVLNEGWKGNEIKEVRNGRKKIKENKGIKLREDRK